MIADSFVVIRDFIRTHLDEDPLALLGGETYSTLTEVAEVYEKEKAECEKRLVTINWRNEWVEEAIKEFHCPECGSGLIDVESTDEPDEKIELFCRDCEKHWSSCEILPVVINDLFASDNIESIHDGGNPVTTTCPICSNDTYHLEDDECLFCGGSVERVCRWCATEIPESELNEDGICAHCQHMLEKDD